MDLNKVVKKEADKLTKKQTIKLNKQKEKTIKQLKNILKELEDNGKNTNTK